MFLINAKINKIVSQYVELCNNPHVVYEKLIEFKFLVLVFYNSFLNSIFVDN